MTAASLIVIVATFFFVDFALWRGIGSRMILDTWDEFYKLFEHEDQSHERNNENSKENELEL